MLVIIIIIGLTTGMQQNQPTSLIAINLYNSVDVGAQIGKLSLAGNLCAAK